MESTAHNNNSHAAALANTQRILDEIERLAARARLLIAEHRHVLATIADLQLELEAAVTSPAVLRDGPKPYRT